MAPRSCSTDIIFDGDTFEVVGTMTKALWMPHCGPTSFVGLRFRPGGAAPFLGDRADVITDSLADAEDVFARGGRELKARLHEAPSPSMQADLLAAFLLARLDRAAAVDYRIAAAAASLDRDPAVRVSAVARELGVSRQHLRRLFLEHTGLSPKVYGRVARLSRVVPMLRAGRQLTEAALDAGYADQAHMNNELRDLVGVTPKKLAAVV